MDTRTRGGSEMKRRNSAMMDWTVRQTVHDNRDRLKKAFAMMRKSKLIARMNFSCCGSCGAYDLGTRVQEADGNKLGYVFYHRQSAESIDDDGTCMIAFGPWYEKDADDDLYDERTVMVGRIAANALVLAGIKTIWNGDPNRCIEVDLTVDATGLA
jgi:hypothetical protein